MSNSLILGVDIGGSHITAALIDLKNSTVLPETLVRKNVDSRKGMEDIVAVWSAALNEAVAVYELSQLRIGIAMPGPFDYENGICQIKDQDKYDALFGLNIKNLLAEKLKTEAGYIKMVNDAGAFLQGEVFGGAGKGCRNVIGVTLGTGLGTSRFHDGVSEDANLWCMPFLDSIAEDYLSTRWFVKRYQELSGDYLPDAKAIADLGKTNAQAKQIFSEFGYNLGLFLDKFIQLDNPETIILGGNIANAADLFMPQTQKLLSGGQKLISINKAKLGEEAALIGAASSWHNELSGFVTMK